MNYLSMQEFTYSSIQVFKCSSVQVFKYSIQLTQHQIIALKGMENSSKLTGWSGNQSWNGLEVSANVSSIDCPCGHIWYEWYKYKLTKILPPIHVCCKVIQTEIYQI